VIPRGGTTSFLPYLSADKYTGHSYFFRHNPGESVELKLIMERGIRARVHTEDENGVPLQGVYVRWMGAGGASGTTDEQGDALLSGMLSRVRTGFICEVRKKGYELAKDPGSLNAMLYTDKPLRIIMRHVADSAGVKGGTPEPALTPDVSGNNINLGVKTKDRASLQASEKYRDDVQYTLYYHVQKGLKMTLDEAVKVENEIEKNPDDLNAYAQLLGFYNNERVKNPDVIKKREKLILYLIQSHPDSAILGMSYGQLFRNDNHSDAQKLWARHVEKNPNSIPILLNAAGAAFQSDLALAEKYLLQAQALEPDSSIISDRLARVYERRRETGKDSDRSDLATKELAELTKIYNKSDNEAHKAMLLPQMAKAAIEIPEELDLADKQADLMISQANTALKKSPPGARAAGPSWRAGKMISPEIDFLFYFGYFTKGMVAVKKGDNEKAVEFLLKSGDAYKAHNSLVQGPNMSLAKALLEAGQKDAVIEFLDKCGKVWKTGQGKIGKWTVEIKDGKTPDFGRSLYY
jgi:tetratricopeptide (TPR) repeat protein